ncbi:MAG: hypothetical protein MUF71_21820 [Candidatus Kapabacteria bacterium]|nr:hypothetical protein [Candidatus Kapabacteria bacterium]
MDELVSFDYEADEFETKYLSKLQAQFMLGGDDWNEAELKGKFISPLIIFSYSANQQYSYFLEREMSATSGEYNLSGKVDGMISTGFRNPKKPLFCLTNTNEVQTLMATLRGKHLSPCLRHSTSTNINIPCTDVM